MLIPRAFARSLSAEVSNVASCVLFSTFALIAHRSAASDRHEFSHSRAASPTLKTADQLDTLKLP